MKKIALWLKLQRLLPKAKMIDKANGDHNRADVRQAFQHLKESLKQKAA